MSENIMAAASYGCDGFEDEIEIGFLWGFSGKIKKNF
jgi:hypothetical protein